MDKYKNMDAANPAAPLIPGVSVAVVLNNLIPHFKN